MVCGSVAEEVGEAAGSDLNSMSVREAEVQAQVRV